ncbi:MAG: glucuronate isomerase [Bryobacteraceae bacterium]
MPTSQQNDTVTAEKLSASDLAQEVQQIVAHTPVFDIHTHLYPPGFQKLFSAGIDDLVTYHYLIAEIFRSSDISIPAFWALTKPQQADLIWDTLFVRNTPLSEACRGVLCVLTSFGLDPYAKTLKEAREFFRSATPEKHLERTMKLAGVTDIVMTNDVFSEQEFAYWEAGAPQHPKLHAALRMDPLLNDWEHASIVLAGRGYASQKTLDQAGIASARKFIDDWIARMKPLYMAVSLPPSFRYPENSTRARLIREVVLPAGRDHKLPFSMMIGVRKAVHPELKDAGDSVGHADIVSVERLCHENPENRFLVSMLSRENQHELCVAARKFSNLMPFGCWWFLNNPSIIREITDERLELLGPTFIPQHSDARILDQIVYKWKHSRHVISASLVETYRALARDGFHVTTPQIERDVQRLFQDNFRRFVGIA